jgi:hypothetical protein
VHKSNLGSQLSIFDTGSSARARPRPNDPPERVQPGALKRPARTTETKRQGRAGQTSCTSVHKANLGSQLSIFDTGSSARARPRPNDPPERVQPGALKRPARTTETKRQGRAGQTSCTSVHKANLGSQLSIFDTGSSARARPRPNDPPIRVQPGALKRPARTTETKRQGRAGQTSCTSVHKANLGSQLSIFDTGSSARARPPPNDPPERVQPGALKRPARTTETKRQGRAGQTSCTSVHKANLGSQLSIFDTGSSARARPRPNDPPERVQPGALKRPARTTETKRQGRAGQTSCTSVHKANLGSQLSIFDTGSSARARPRPNDPPERVQPGALKRPARTTETKRQGRAGQTSCTSVHKSNLGSQLSIFDTGSSARARPRPNDPPERVQPGALKRPARTTETKRQGRAGQTSCTSVHKSNLGSQLSIFDTGSSARGRPRPNDPPVRVQPGALKRPARTTETKRQVRAGQTSCTSVHKANLGSQLSIFDTGSSARARPRRANDPPERPKRSDKGGPGKRAARACTKPTSGNNLAFLIRARPPGRALARTTRPNEFNRAPSNDPPERPKRSDKGETGKRAARACTKPTSGHNLAFLIRARPPGRALARTTRPNEFTRAPSNDPPERPKRSDKGEPGKRAARACTKPTSGHNLAFLIRARPPGRALARTTRPNEFTRAPSNDPTERVHPGALKRPARTTHPNKFTRAPSNDPPERPTRTTRPNEFTRAPSNDPPERFFMGARTTETNRQGRAGQTSCTNVHKANLGSQLSIFDTTLARTTRPNEFTRAPSNDPPERPTRTSSHGRPQTTRPNDPPERPARTTHPNDPPERVHTGALKRPARTTHPNDPPELVHTGALKRPARTTHPNELPERVHTGALKRPARTNDRNEPTRESRANELHERAQSQPPVTT